MDVVEDTGKVRIFDSSEEEEEEVEVFNSTSCYRYDDCFTTMESILHPPVVSHIQGKLLTINASLEAAREGTHKNCKKEPKSLQLSPINLLAR